MEQTSRWAALFADIEAQAEAAEADQAAGEVADRTRRERRAVSLASRLEAVAGEGVTLRLVLLGGEQVTGTPQEVGGDWVLLGEEPRGEALVPLGAVASVVGLPGSARQLSAVAARRDLGQVLRAVARDRAGITLVLRDGSSLSGTPDAVGADTLDLALHPLGEARRRREVTGVATVPLAALALVRRARP